MRNKCKNLANILNTHLYNMEVPVELKNHLEDCKDCKFVFEENLRLKKIVKAAVERTPVPNDLAIRIADKLGFGK